MSDRTAIQWTDATWNPTRGCSRVSEGCRNCYAERVAARFSNYGQAYEGLATMRNGQPRWTGDVDLVAKHLDDPLKWRHPRRIFVDSMSDLFHENVSRQVIDMVFSRMALAPRHTFQILTKRPERMREYMKAEDGRGVLGKAWALLGSPRLRNYDHQDVTHRPWPLPNVWLGVSAESQETADHRIPILLDTPAALRFVSAEPLLEAVDMSNFVLGVANPDPCPVDGNYRFTDRKLDWVIVGGESGQFAREMDPEWALSIATQCAGGKVAFFMKQMGAVYSRTVNGNLHGSDCIPADLAIREFPPARPERTES